MFYINDAGQEVHSELTHDYEAEADALSMRRARTGAL